MLKKVGFFKNKIALEFLKVHADFCSLRLSLSFLLSKYIFIIKKPTLRSQREEANRSFDLYTILF